MGTKNLTNQKLSERFDNAFTLVNYAIDVARGLIKRGEELSQNPATMVLEAIAENKVSYLQEELHTADEEDED